jgi:hypothetical protein
VQTRLFLFHVHVPDALSGQGAGRALRVAQSCCGATGRLLLGPSMRGVPVMAAAGGSAAAAVISAARRPR